MKQYNVPKSEIQTFVFLDFETTGLLRERAKITEMCLLAVSRRHMRELDTDVPRIQNKLVLCLNPEKELTDVASELTGNQ